MNYPKNGKSLDLNKLTILDDTTGLGVPLSDNSAMVDGAKVEVYFRNLEAKLIEKIRQAQMVFGCVAWLTSEPILNALANVKHGVSIVVQKEDFLRPDIGSGKDWSRKLRAQYARLKEVPDRYYIGGLVSSLSVSYSPSIAPVRCVGNYNSDKKPAMPRMHNKFLIFCSAEVERLLIPADSEYSSGPPFEEEFVRFVPYAVWTGSFNLTFNAANSLENAVYITNEDVVDAYFKEWQQILALSEPLDWTKAWVEPEWRIGT